MIETYYKYQLLQHFGETPPSTYTATTGDTTARTLNSGEAVTVNIDNNTELNSKLVRPVDGSKYEICFDAIVELLIIIPMKYENALNYGCSCIELGCPEGEQITNFQLKNDFLRRKS